MRVLGNPINDGRIGCQHFLIEMTIGEYFEISRNILQNNEYQRRRVKIIGHPQNSVSDHYHI